MQIRVIRGNGDKQGGNITNNLLTDDAVGKAAGIHAINDSTSKKNENGNGPLSPFLDTGKLTQVSNSKESYRGKLKFFSQTIDIDPDGRRYYPTSSFIIERVL